MPRAFMILCMATAIAACTESPPRSVQYFEAHPDEATRVSGDCQRGLVSGDECENAKIAVGTAEGRARFERFRGK